MRIRPIRFVKGLCFKIKALFYWLPFIWKDRWWDWIFIIQLLEAKLRWDAKHYKKHGHLISNEKQAKQMLIAAALCKRLADGNYNLFFSKKWVPNSEEENKEGLFLFNDHLEGEWIGPFAGDNWIKYEDYMIQQDLDYLFKILNKHLQTWWD